MPGLVVSRARVYALGYPGAELTVFGHARVYTLGYPGTELTVLVMLWYVLWDTRVLN